MEKRITPLRRIMAAKGLKHNYVADRLGIHPATFSGYVNGLRPLPSTHKRSLATILNVPMREL